MLDVINQDYVLTAESKGLSRGQIIRRHILRNRMSFTIFPNSAFAPRFNPTWITRAYSKNCGSFSQYVEIVVLAKVPQKIPAVKHKITIRLFFIETSFLDK